MLLNSNQDPMREVFPTDALNVDNAPGMQVCCVAYSTREDYDNEQARQSREKKPKTFTVKLNGVSCPNTSERRGKLINSKCVLITGGNPDSLVNRKMSKPVGAR